MRFLCLVFLALPAVADEWVRVRLSQEPAGRFEIGGTVHRLQGMESVYREVAIPQLQKLTVQFKGRWLVEGFKKFALVYNNKNLIIEGYRLTLNGKPVPDKLILNSEKNQINIVAILPIEKYVLGVVAHEMPRNWP